MKKHVALFAGLALACGMANAATPTLNLGVIIGTNGNNSGLLSGLLGNDGLVGGLLGGGNGNGLLGGLLGGDNGLLGGLLGGGNGNGLLGGLLGGGNGLLGGLLGGGSTLPGLGVRYVGNQTLNLVVSLTDPLGLTPLLTALPAVENGPLLVGLTGRNGILTQLVRIDLLGPSSRGGLLQPVGDLLGGLANGLDSASVGGSGSGSATIEVSGP